MSNHHDPTDPDLMSPEERLVEIASILASGILRMCRPILIAAAHSPTISIPETLQNSLDDCRDESLNGRCKSVQKNGFREEIQ